MLAFRITVEDLFFTRKEGCTTNVRSSVLQLIVLQKHSSNFKSLKCRKVYSNAAFTYYYVLIVCVFPPIVFDSTLCKSQTTGFQGMLV